MKKLLFLILLFPMTIFAQHKVTLHITNVKNTKGEIRAALYTSKEDFLKFDKVFKAAAVKATKGKTTFIIANIPPGTYAIAVFHDENSNEKLDTNFMGIPKEPLGFSIGKMKTFGPPSFKECSFELDSHKEITIEIK
tara:strand:+ start:19199 stop:19609 length:411 start_codon:yes stop_codon:yes gene_type:complete